MSKYEILPHKRTRRQRKPGPSSRNLNKTTTRMIAVLKSEFTLLKLDVLNHRVELSGVTPEVLKDPFVAHEFHRAVALAVSLNKEEFQLSDICPPPDDGRVSADQVNQTSRHLSDHLCKALQACDRESSEIRLSRNCERFDLRVYLGECAPSRSFEDFPSNDADR